MTDNHQYSNKNRKEQRGLLRLAVFLVILISVSAGVSIITANWIIREKKGKHVQSHAHAWLHEELGLSEEEARRVDAFEADYRHRREALLGEFNRKIEELAAILRSSDSFSPEVNHTVHELHEAHGKLQKLSIEHYYDMLSVLPPEKQERLRTLAVESLSEPE